MAQGFARRHKHNLSNYRLTTFDMGYLVPVGLQEVLPGDSFKMTTSALIRVSPLVAPVMHPVTARIHHWFVPNRHVVPGDTPGAYNQTWENFITGGPYGDDDTQLPNATIVSQSGNLHDYYALPINNQTGFPFQSMPIRGYNRIYNEWYRDPWIQATSGMDSFQTRRIQWEKDYYTTARPSPQRGPDITIPLGQRANVVNDNPGASHDNVSSDAEGNAFFGGSTQPEAQLFADLTTATATNVNDWRRAFALQRYQEARARYGARYPEYLRYAFNVNPSDARLDRPEYLGGGKATINFSEVLQTAPGDANDESVVGELKGHGIAAVRTRPFIRHFNEHGYVHTMISVRPKTIYSQGFDRHWLRSTKEDFYQRELEKVGMQTITNKEIYADQADGDEVFGFQDRYAEYRHTQSKVTGEFRDLLNYWHMAREFSDTPALNNQFLNCDATKRIHAEQTQHSLWVMVQNKCFARRPVSKSTSNAVL